MTDSIIPIAHMENSLEHFHGQEALTDLLKIEPKQHLQIIKQIQMAEKGNSDLAFEITPGSTADDFEFSVKHNKVHTAIGGSTPEEETLNKIAKIASGRGRSEEDVRAILNGRTSTTILHERFNGSHIEATSLDQ